MCKLLYKFTIWACVHTIPICTSSLTYVYGMVYVQLCSHMITLCPGSLILGNVMKLPDLSESLKIPGSQLKLSSDPIGQGERYYVRIFYCTCTVRVFLILHDQHRIKIVAKPCFQGKLEWCTKVY